MPTITGVINQQLFKTHEYGPVYLVLGFHIIISCFIFLFCFSLLEHYLWK